jgi:hypothetical protein
MTKDLDKKVAHAMKLHYERGFIDGMQKQMQSSLDKAVNRMEQPEQHQDWCASMTQMLMSMPPRPAPCNCKPPQRTWVGLDHQDKKKFSSWLDSKTDDEVFTAIDNLLEKLNT